MASPITRRQAVAGLSTLGVTAVALPEGAAAATQAIEEAARKEGTLTWYTGQVDAEKAERLGKAFTAQHPGVKVAVIRTTGQVAYQRLLLDIKNKSPQCDMFSTTDISHMPALRERNELMAYTPAGADGLMPEFLSSSDPGYWYVTNASRYFIMYNSDKVKGADVPKRWTDLLDPKWKGRVATGHPAFSGCTGVWALSLKKVYGWEFFEKLAQNRPRIGRSAIDPVTLMTAGEALIGPSSATTAYQAIDRQNPVAVVHPADGLVLCVTPSGIPAQAPHPNAAKLFMDWLMSDEYSRMMAEHGTEPLRASVAPRPGVPALSTQKVISLTTEEIRKGIPEVIEQWRDTFGS
ncbi:MAG: ABC transporter substrate-binding protein [Acetobacteraceae bacterium]